jgi:hypothetical protein
VVQAGLGKKQDLISKITRAKRAAGVAQVVECCLPSKCEALSSNPNIAPQKNKVKGLYLLGKGGGDTCSLLGECFPTAGELSEHL